MKWPYESQSLRSSREKLISALMKNCRDHFRTWSKFNGVLSRSCSRVAKSQGHKGTEKNFEVGNR